MPLVEGNHAGIKYQKLFGSGQNLEAKRELLRLGFGPTRSSQAGLKGWKRTRTPNSLLRLLQRFVPLTCGRDVSKFTNSCCTRTSVALARPRNALMTGAMVSAMPRFAIKTHNGLSRRLLLQDPQAIAKSSAVCPSRYGNGGK
jgi:hypothetical protein